MLWPIERFLERRTRYDRISLYLSIGAQSTAGDDAALVVPQPLPRLKRQASMPGMHPFVTLFVLIALIGETTEPNGAHRVGSRTPRLEITK
jgi:hypothetical protein